MLLIALGLVAATMRQLNKPSTAERLGQLFATPEATEQQPPSHQFVINTVEAVEQPKVVAEPAEVVEPAVRTAAGEDASDALALVQDNTYFRPAETEAWFGLLDRLQQMDDQQLREASLGELTYTQLLKQPQVYRGQVVTIRGTVRREEVEHPSENSLGIEAYHRLWIQPRGGVNWPLVVYCLELPNDFPRGDKLQALVSVTGFYFKNWSYPLPDGLGIAPVVLARSIDWQPAAAQPVRRKMSSVGLTQALVVAGVFALLVVWLVIRNTRRPPHGSRSTQELTFPDESAVETVHQQLQRLSEEELQE